MVPFIRQVIVKSIKDQEAVPLSKSFFSLSSTEYSNETASGVLISTGITVIEAENALAKLTDYLDRNLETLCCSLSLK